MRSDTAELEDGATLVTANARLARDLRRTYDIRRRDAGDTSWAAADILPLDGWLRRTWDEAVRRGAERGAVLLSEAQEQLVWERIIAASAGDSRISTYLRLRRQQPLPMRCLGVRFLSTRPTTPCSKTPPLSGLAKSIEEPRRRACGVGADSRSTRGGCSRNGASQRAARCSMPV